MDNLTLGQIVWAAWICGGMILFLYKAYVVFEKISGLSD